MRLLPLLALSLVTISGCKAIEAMDNTETMKTDLAAMKQTTGGLAGTTNALDGNMLELKRLATIADGKAELVKDENTRSYAPPSINLVVGAKEIAENMHSDELIQFLDGKLKEVREMTPKDSEYKTNLLGNYSPAYVGAFNLSQQVRIIALQAGAASRVATAHPEAALAAMRAVENEGRETLAGLRRMLVALRAADAGRDPDLTPAGLADVDRLAATTTAAGVRVEVHRLGEARQLPPDIDLSAFRIVQESVTNVVRHAGTRACRVTLDYRDDEELAVEITDDGLGCGSSTDTGFGLAGMRERVALLHGEFTAAPRPEGGFRVTARLPLPVAVR